MSLPLPVIERLFDRLLATYGNEFLNKYAGLELAKIKTVWAHELSGYATNLHPIAFALENLPAKAPNVIEFRNICRLAPAKDVPALPEPKADPARVAAELAKLGHVRDVQTMPHGLKEWAYRLKTRHEAGGRLNANQIRCYRAALEAA